MTDNPKKPSAWIPIIISLLTLVAGGGWGKYYLERRSDTEEQNQRYIAEYLSPIQTLLNDNNSIHQELTTSYLEPVGGILESYIEKVQKDGFDAHALMKTRIRRLDENSDEIVLLLKQYAGHDIVTAELSEQIVEFRKHAIAWSDRLDAVAEVIKTRKQLPIAKPFPPKFPEAIQAEIDARKNNT